MNWKEILAGVVLGLAAVAAAQAISGQWPQLRSDALSTRPAVAQAPGRFPITRADYDAEGDRWFVGQDTDHDGVISGEERIRGGVDRGNGLAAVRSLTLVEFRQQRARRFEQLDANHNGIIDRDEAMAARRLAQARRAARAVHPEGESTTP